MEEWTVRSAVARIVELGLVDADSAAEAVDEDCLDAPLKDYGDTPAEALTVLLVDLGTGFEVHTDDVDDLLEGYESILADLAACTNGLFTVTDVELAETDDGEVLRFLRNGEPVEWPVDHGDNYAEDEAEAEADDEAGGEYLDPTPFFEHLDEFTDPDASPRRAGGVAGRPRR